MRSFLCGVSILESYGALRLCAGCDRPFVDRQGRRLDPDGTPHTCQYVPDHVPPQDERQRDNSE